MARSAVKSSLLDYLTAKEQNAVGLLLAGVINSFHDPFRCISESWNSVNTASLNAEFKEKLLAVTDIFGRAGEIIIAVILN